MLTTDGWLPFKRKHFGRDKAIFNKATELNLQANARLISYDEFIGEIAQMANMPPAAAKEAINMVDDAANGELFQYIKTLKPKYKIGMLSNTSQNMLKKLFTDDEIGLFDSIVLSYEEGIAKPDENAYRIASERLNCQPSECVFIDDQEKHIIGANNAGMLGIWYKDFEQMRTELEKILAG